MYVSLNLEIKHLFVFYQPFSNIVLLIYYELLKQSI